MISPALAGSTSFANSPTKVASTQTQKGAFSAGCKITFQRQASTTCDVISQATPTTIQTQSRARTSDQSETKSKRLKTQNRLAAETAYPTAGRTQSGILRPLNVVHHNQCSRGTPRGLR